MDPAGRVLRFYFHRVRVERPNSAFLGNSIALQCHRVRPPTGSCPIRPTCRRGRRRSSAMGATGHARNWIGNFKNYFVRDSPHALFHRVLCGALGTFTAKSRPRGEPHVPAHGTDEGRARKTPREATPPQVCSRGQNLFDLFSLRSASSPAQWPALWPALWPAQWPPQWPPQWPLLNTI